MDLQKRQTKNSQIAQTMKETFKKRESQVCRVFTVKIQENQLKESKKEQLKMMFVEAKWLKNADVNGLKLINDTFGHDAEDDLLRVTAVCMKKFFPDEDILCRMGGDEFFIIIRESQDTLNKRILSFLNYAKNFEYNSIKTISISYGIANLEKYPNCTISELEKATDKEMYHYKAEYYKNSAMDRRRR